MNKKDKEVFSMRKTNEELQALKEHYGVKELWSFSKVNKLAQISLS